MIKELIEKIEEIKNSKESNKLFEIKIKRFEDLGIDSKIKVKRPNKSILSSFIERGNDINYLLSECIVEPNLSDNKLLKAYKANCKKDLIEQIFTQEEITDMDSIMGKIISANRTVSLEEQIADDIKN